MQTIDEVIDEIEKGVNNLKSKTLYPTLLHKEKIDGAISIPFLIGRYKYSGNIDDLKELVNIYKETSHASPEVGQTIWDATIFVKDEETTLDRLFSVLRKLVEK